MAISTKESNHGLNTKEKIEILKKNHVKLFEKLGVEDPLYIPKMVFGNPLVAVFFKSNLRKGKDIYTEKVSKSFDSEDETRTLYKWVHRSDWEDRYPTRELGDANTPMHVIPFEEFEPIIDKKSDYDFGLIDPDQDPPISELTIRDLAAMLTGKPVSLKPWLNKIIQK